MLDTLKMCRTCENVPHLYKGPGKRGHIVADTLLLTMFPGLRKLGNICVGNNVSATMCPRLPGP